MKLRNCVKLRINKVKVERTEFTAGPELRYLVLNVANLVYDALNLDLELLRARCLPCADNQPF